MYQRRDGLEARVPAKGDKKLTGPQWIIFAAIVCVILYSVCSPSTPAAANRPSRPYDGYGGGGGGDDDSTDPPPPYTPRAPKTKPKSSSRSSTAPASSNSIPTFLAGAATGAAAGYGAGTWNANRQNRNRTAQQEPPLAAGPSSWFQRQEPNRNAPANYPTYNAPSSFGGPSSSSPGPSSSRHESTGFGGTTRR